MLNIFEELQQVNRMKFIMQKKGVKNSFEKYSI